MTEHPQTFHDGRFGEKSKPKRWLACDFCRSKKVRCNGGHPCTYCQSHGQICQRSRTRRQSAKEKEMSFDAMAQRLAKLESLLESPQKPSADVPVASMLPAFTASSLSSENTASPPCLNIHPALYDRRERDRPADGLHLMNDNAAKQTTDGHANQISDPSCIVPLDSPDHNSAQGRDCLRPDDEPLLDDLGGISIERQEESSVYSAETYLEYQGPRSFLSICSPTGMEWVAEKTKTHQFHKSATRFTRDMTRRLKLSKKLSPQRAPEPEPENAWIYTSAYFERGSESSFGIVERLWFESRLRAHLAGGECEDEQSWYALRNMVYAFGCRIVLSSRSSFSRASEDSWPWFENARSVFTDLMFMPTSIVAVQALTLMAHFTEGLGTHLLQYPLTAAALRLACSKGLHRQPPSSWKLPDHEISNRSWTFWAVYCLDKHIASRSGRPSSIDDEEINCQIPNSIPSGGSVGVQARQVLIKLHQLSSFVGRSVSSARAFLQKPRELMQTVNGLHQKAETLSKEVWNVLSLNPPLDPTRLPPEMSLHTALTIHFTYFGLLFDIHTTLTYPWSCGIINLRRHPVFRDQVENSYTIVAEASRAVLLATRHVPLDATCPFLLAYYIPIYAMINLFIHILQAPHLATVHSDLLLMEIGAAHFTRLEIATESQISTPFAKDISQMARSFVEQARAAGVMQSPSHNGDSIARDNQQATRSASLDQPNLTVTADGGDSNYENGFFQNWFDMDIDADMEMWSSLLPIVDGDGFSPGDLQFVHPTMNV